MINIKDYRQDIISILITVILSVVIIFASSSIFNNGFLNDKLNKGVEYYKAEVKEVLEEKLQVDKYIEDIELGYQNVTLKILDGPYKGNEYNITNNVSRLYNFKVEEGSKIIAGMYFMDGSLKDVTIIGYKRSNTLGILVLLFFIIILLVGGFKGLKSIISLLFTMICVVFLMLPLMLRGINPIISAIVIAIISITVTLLLVSGINKKSFSAILGTLFGVLIAGILAYVFGYMSYLSGINMEEAESIMYIAETTGLKINGIMFAGILVASLGAVMDVAMSISSSVFEINSINKEINIKGLFKSGMNIGRDIIGTMSNTLILAFAGGSLNTLILIYSSNMTANRLLNLDVLGTEIIQGLAGSIGIILTVPITAIISSYLSKKEKMNLY
ncbi:YibE/F family protein [Clostridium septicum]|uniref:YibE/F family protein n=1 Tax=Clostridium septicum TaxID=1504 RepID=A0ABY5B4A5_CLOSE|nr:YibE/F family protein [Clostridium septicum]UEC19886.1 YibE/F family protein [Clostridium septicum]USS02054.1 YibE/F family protein [Clostridium septicum]WLF70629.1 YibE/F family protein [Clostridium septicum]